jgi:hypothetical protein
VGSLGICSGRGAVDRAPLRFSYAAVDGSSTVVQNGQRRAPSGMSLKHSGHVRVVGSASGAGLRVRAVNAFIGFTTTKKIAAATVRNAITALINSP